MATSCVDDRGCITFVTADAYGLGVDLIYVPEAMRSLPILLHPFLYCIEDPLPLPIIKPVLWDFDTKPVLSRSWTEGQVVAEEEGVPLRRRDP
jgi:hypothetical protein